ncbi:recombinase family protein [Anatilimnocola floriformis]|uniref:recombinase family protein n=1 Tax=Anatilimnocola floriformis TaxID=2948575 RepID=UPI0028F4271A|nr:recombinase family protein [Anatilimnocola floriformis]
MLRLPNFQMKLPERLGPWAWGYGRQSHQDAIDLGEAIANQGIRTRAYWERELRAKGVAHFTFVPDDYAVSARTNPFMLRVAGKMLFDLMRPGDHFIVDRVDRLWRSVADFIDVRRSFKSRGVTLHIVDALGASLQDGTPAGEFSLNLMVAAAQLESDQCSHRTKRRKKAMREQGRYHGNRRHVPLGCRVIGQLERTEGRTVKNTLQLVWDADYRRFMGEIVRIADELGNSAREVAKMIPQHFREFMGETFYRKAIVGERGKTWDAHAIVRHYWREKQYQALPHFNPNTIRFSAFDPPESARFRDIGRNEPDTPNPFPFLDGRTPPTLEALKQLAA